MADNPLDRSAHPLRPGDFARILLAGGGDSPRARARDQQADILGEALRRRVLNRLVLLDPESDELESVLLTIVAELDEPAGSTRAVCTAIVQEWEMARLSPSFWPFLIGQAMQADDAERGPRVKAATRDRRTGRDPRALSCSRARLRFKNSSAS